VKQNLYYARRQKYPPLPHSTREVQERLDALTLETVKKENFVFVNDHQEELVIFTTETNLKCLGETKAIFLDGTFQFSPSFFGQFLTIHGLFSERNYVPLIYCLLNSKRQASYELCFNCVSDLCKEHGVDLQPNTVVTDFEIGLINACKVVWSNSRQVGCRFHLTQAWWRAIQRFGMTTAYKTNTDVGQWLKLFFGLPFLKPERVPQCFEGIIGQIPKGTGNHPYRVNEFISYMKNNYVLPNSTYPPSLWAEFCTIDNHTTNACEAFHRHFNHNFTSPRPNIYEFIEVLLNFQKEVYVLINSRNEPSRKKSHSEDTKLKFMNFCFKKFETGAWSEVEFLKRISFYYASAMSD